MQPRVQTGGQPARDISEGVFDAGTRRQFELSDAQWADRGSSASSARAQVGRDSTIDAWSTPCSGYFRTAASWGGTCQSTTCTATASTRASVDAASRASARAFYAGAPH